MFKKKKRKIRPEIRKKFPLPNELAPSRNTSSEAAESEEESDEELLSRSFTYTSFKTPTQNPPTNFQSEIEETTSGPEIVGRTKYDLLWNLRKKLNLYILLPFIYVTVVVAAGRVDKTNIVLHIAILIIIYIIIFIGGKISKGRL